MLYYYIDETYRTDAEYWHCNIGGALIHSSLVMPIELALSQCLYDRLCDVKHFDPKCEFKYSNFFKGLDDDLKLELCRILCQTLSKFDVSFLISHAKCRKDRIAPMAKFRRGEQDAIQELAFMNIAFLLAPYTAKDLVQTVVDLGLSESFRPIYQIYVGMSRGLITMKLMGFSDDQITLPNFLNLPVPLFVDSKDSRLIQLSDLINGLYLAKEVGEMTDFKKRLLEATSTLESNINIHSVDWNAKRT